jgi:hypothetical protein
MHADLGGNVLLWSQAGSYSIVRATLGVIICGTSTILWQTASLGQVLSEKTIMCLCQQKVGNEGPRSIGMCAGHYMGSYYSDKCGTNKECLVREMNNGYGNKVEPKACR